MGHEVHIKTLFTSAKVCMKQDTPKSTAKAVTLLNKAVEIADRFMMATPTHVYQTLGVCLLMELGNLNATLKVLNKGVARCEAMGESHGQMQMSANIAQYNVDILPNGRYGKYNKVMLGGPDGGVHAMASMCGCIMSKKQAEAATWFKKTLVLAEHVILLEANARTHEHTQEHTPISAHFIKANALLHLARLSYMMYLYDGEIHDEADAVMFLHKYLDACLHNCTLSCECCTYDCHPYNSSRGIHIYIYVYICMYVYIDIYIYICLYVYMGM